MRPSRIFVAERLNHSVSNPADAGCDAISRGSASAAFQHQTLDLSNEFFAGLRGLFPRVSLVSQPAITENLEF